MDTDYVESTVDYERDLRIVRAAKMLLGCTSVAYQLGADAESDPCQTRGGDPARPVRTDRP